MQLRLLALAAIFLAQLSAAPALRGHDYWLEPENPRPGGKGKLQVRLMLGAGLGSGQEKATQRRRFAAARLLTSRGESDLLPELTEATKPLLELNRRGVRSGALLAVERTPARITLDHVKFNTYLREEGLVQAILDRTRAREMGRAGRERYTRFLKLFLPGPARGARGHPLSTRVLGQTLEIVPASDLSQLRRGHDLSVQVLFENRPLAGASLTHACRPRAGEVTRVRRLTDAEGRATFPIEGGGLHLLRLVHMRRIAADPENFQQPEWESFWSSYAFPVRGR